MKPYTLAQARLILSHVYCVHCLPEGGGWVYPWAVGAGEALCSRCPCRVPEDLRLYVASNEEAAAWLAKENAAIERFFCCEVCERNPTCRNDCGSCDGPNAQEVVRLRSRR